ncbi:MAG: lipoyl protein ligase domain-containing protein [Candidatus Woesearchaeota archaeon]
MEKRIAQYIDLNKTNYLEVFELQKKIAEKRLKNEIPDTIIMTEHNPVINFGMTELYNTFSEKLYYELQEKNIEPTKENAIKYLNEIKKIPFTKTQRGGGATYIGPGQLNIYPIIDYEALTNQALGVNKYKDIINELMNNTIQSFKINSKIDDQNLIRKGKKLEDERSKSGDRKDIWITENGKHYKLGGRGIHTKGKVAYHGFNFYVKKGSTNGFEYVNTCGYTPYELKTTSMEEASRKEINMNDFKERVLREIQKQFKYTELKEIKLENINL